MHPDLIAYVSGALDEPARAAFETLLKGDVDLQRQVARARRCLAPLQGDSPEVPPADLFIATITRVAEHACKSLPTAPLETMPSRLAFDRPWWRRIDVVVAASIFLTALGLLVPGLLHLRVLGVQTQCENNLRELWNGLNAYQTQKHSLPDVASAPRPAASMVIPMLREAGVLPANLVACCPSAADGVACLNVGLQELANMPGSEFQKTAAHLFPGYAYSLGFRDGAGRIHGPASALPDVPTAQMPLLADAGPVGSFGNSPNHASRGQNVLFTDGHVAFKTQRSMAGLPGDDIYLNQDNQIAAGLNARDTVLGTGNAAP